jgi:phospholipid N-methyltransferase
VYRGWSQSYSDDDKKNNRYRDVIQKIAHLRSFKAKLFLKIKEADMKDAKGEWYTSTYDEVICLPMLEMSCGRIIYIEEFFYLYNFGLGTNDLQVDQGLQKRIADEVKYRRQKYECI